MRQALQRAWLRRGALARALSPLALLYGAAAAARRALYAHRILRSTRSPVPVIVVGNVVAGGAGKTPVVIELLRHLQARGLRPGMVSRGYGRRGSACREVLASSVPQEVGDEPLLVKQRSGVPVFVAARRAEAARALLAAHPEVAVIVCDDGLQHHALARDIEVCVFDERGTGNGLLLPAGPLREPWPRQVDLVLRPPSVPISGHAVRRALADHAVAADGSRVALERLRARPVHAVAGIANPQAFFDMLAALGLQLASTTALPDHHAFAAVQGLPAGGGAMLLCTEKDAVKLWRLRPDALAVPLHVQIEPGFWSALDDLLDAKLSSPHGSQTA